MKVKAKKEIVPMVRINTRILREQHAFIKKVAKKTARTEGQVLREIIEIYIKLY